MKAIQLTRHGGPEVLELRDVSEPEAGPGEAKVLVQACGINGLDIYVREGGTETEVPLPLIPGADIAGLVTAVGEGTDDVRVGDRVVVNPRFYCGRCVPCLRGNQSACFEYAVLGWHRDGGYAEYVVAPADKLRNIGDELTYEAAAAVPIAYATAWRMLVHRAHLRAGERVLILGASGGVGTATVQLARLMGAQVAAVTSSSHKIGALQRLGADLVLQQGALHYDATLQDWTDGLGVDVLVQMIGGDTWLPSLDHVSRLGRLVFCSAITGGDPPAGLGTILWKQISVLGSTGGSPLDFEHVVRLVVAGRLNPLVDTTYSLDEVAQAHVQFEKHEHVGKLVLTPASGT